jgi:hypothetical protein
VKPKSMAQEGLTLLESAVIELLEEFPEGLQNVEVAERLDIHSEREGEQKDYLSWSILSLLMADGRVQKVGNKYIAAGARR